VAHLDYPHGSFTPLARDWDRLLLVAGGIGIAPMFSILRALAAAGETRPVTLVYGVNRAQDLVGRDELNAMRSTLALDLHLFVDQPPGEADSDPALRRRAELLPTIAAVARTAQTAGGHGVLTMICGPVGMPRAVEAVLRAEGVPRRAIVYERFDYD
jgi:ferredoxin-NADP reductase